ncbi:cupin domain-containing protein [Arcobacter sp. CECT 8985]|uniref:cupin domain-containing protein n=1 Tax=Arcobacter sp. CECT 8985 TaxID=1935424 RepID=UPI00100B392F|nr:cupin domain-containing protein [Arcobacter sp. CECT 8985]RXJ84064.1 cupin [Arcobacter sp. CECT 8985]
MQVKNLFDNIKIDKKAEQFISLLDTKNIKIEKIVSNGQKSPKDFWYDQEEHEFILLLQGSAVLEFEHEEVELNQGDFLNIDSHRKHRVKYTNEKQPTIWLAIFY